MTYSTIKPFTKPMKRSAMKRTAFKVKPLSGLLRTANLASPLKWPTLPKVRKVRMKSSRPKMTPIRRSARGEECTLRIVGICNYDTDTTVWAHSNRLQDGKGMGIKANDAEGCYACSACHAWLDGGWVRDKGMTAGLLAEFFDAAREKSRAILKRKKLLPGEAQC